MIRLTLSLSISHLLSVFKMTLFPRLTSILVRHSPERRKKFILSGHHSKYSPLPGCSPNVIWFHKPLILVGHSELPVEKASRRNLSVRIFQSEASSPRLLVLGFQSKVSSRRYIPSVKLPRLPPLLPTEIVSPRIMILGNIS